ncbi:TRAFs-binding domain-containing protein [Zoogloea sp.]|jgi:tetratricopeptide (TPR) repeat protein|uniref:TRAFs-binding domain-containing protein n=1 Tax=Zoogloea sp. TaxID=49181 RepID=UPI0037DA0D3F
MKLHAFVAMPFGTKPNDKGEQVDFNRIFDELIKPALEDAGLEVLRADKEQRAGDIRLDMFQELLMADLVVADLSIDNPNVWYELGVRHALRARGVVLVQGPRNTKPFDIYTDRKLTYHLKDGAPDPAHLADDRKAITDMTVATLAAWHERPVSPVYGLLPNLREPDWKSLRIGAVREYWHRHDAWAALIDKARKAGRPEDVLVLADEAPVTALRVEARLKAGTALLKGRHYNYALEQFDLALGFDPTNLEAARQRGICLQRLKRPDDARSAYEAILVEHPGDVETQSLLARLDKDAWMDAWNHPEHSPAKMREDAAYEEALLKAAIVGYAGAFRAAPDHYYSGINAVTLMHLHRHLTNEADFDAEARTMAGGVAWAATCERSPAQRFWAAATLGDLAILNGNAEDVKDAYQAAIALADKDWFALDACLAQLRLLASLGFRPDEVGAGITTFERALTRLEPPTEKGWQPRKVFLFSGHMIDSPARPTPRFPADKEPIAAQAIADALARLGAGKDDLAITQGASGGDLLFTEACLALGMHVQLLLPLPEADFIEQSILPATNGDAWRDRYFAVRDHTRTLPNRVMPEVLGPLPKDASGKPMSPFERCNHWLLHSTLSLGVKRGYMICLWNGSGGDGPGGTEHMVREVKQRTGQVVWLDTRKLW